MEAICPQFPSTPDNFPGKFPTPGTGHCYDNEVFTADEGVTSATSSRDGRYKRNNSNDLSTVVHQDVHNAADHCDPDKSARARSTLQYLNEQDVRQKKISYGNGVNMFVANETNHGKNIISSKTIISSTNNEGTSNNNSYDNSSHGIKTIKKRSSKCAVSDDCPKLSNQVSAKETIKYKLAETDAPINSLPER